MHETVLRDFFTRAATIEVMADDLRGAMVSDGGSVVRHPIVDMASEFTVESSHLSVVCEAFTAQHLQPGDVRAIAFCLMASDAFEWDADTSDGARVAEVLSDWCSPEINFPIDAEHVAKWKTYLDTGVDQLRINDA